MEAQVPSIHSRTLSEKHPSLILRMQEDHAEAMPRNRPAVSLKELCVKAASQHVSALNLTALLELPKALIMDLLPRLNIHDLNTLQPALNRRGISTYSAWIAILRDIKGAHRVVELQTEEEGRQEAIDTFFQIIFYGFKSRGIDRHVSHGNSQSLLLAVAPSVRHFYLRPAQVLQRAPPEQRQLLTLLEDSVRCVHVKHRVDVMKCRYALYVLHRLLDHGGANELILYGQDPALLAWVFHTKGLHCAKDQGSRKSVYGERAALAPCKRPRLECVSAEQHMDPESLCRSFTSSRGPLPECCPRGQIQALHVRQCETHTFTTLLPLLPAWSCLHSLALHSVSIFCDSDVLTLARSLTQLSHAASCSLTDLRIGVLPHTALIETLLDACPSLRSLYVEIHPLDVESHLTETGKPTVLSDFPLETLSVKLPQVRTNLDSITSVLKRTPNLTSLCIAGIRLATVSSHCQLFTLLSESNSCLRRLYLEDLNLAGCLPGIRSLLSRCMLEELTLRDCRLLEKSSNKEEYLEQLVGCLKEVPSLRSLCLAQNRLAKTVPALAELFGGPSPSRLNKLDISSNFIQPVELLALGQRLEKTPPPHRVTLDLKKNPWDRDRETWLRALAVLRPRCDLETDSWKSRDTMADHISNM